MSSSKKRFNILENIENHISMLKPEPDVAERLRQILFWRSLSLMLLKR